MFYDDIVKVTIGLTFFEFFNFMSLVKSAANFFSAVLYFFFLSPNPIAKKSLFTAFIVRANTHKRGLNNDGDLAFLPLLITLVSNPKQQATGSGIRIIFYMNIQKIALIHCHTTKVPFPYYILLISLNC